MTATTRVVKLGGSLLDMPDLASRVKRWLAAESPSRTVLIVGGGKMVDAIRQQAREANVDDGAAHWLAIEAMSHAARLVAQLLGGALLARSLAEVQQTTAPDELIVLDVQPLLREEEPSLPGVRLPIGWSATSDSIAARVAEVLSADELILLKSAAPPDGADFERLAKIGYVDEHFPSAAESLRSVRFVNLRDFIFSQRLFS